MIRIPNNICFKGLDLSEIFKIGYEYFEECGVYGVVKGLTDRYEISRQQIYNLLHRVVGSLEASVSGPRSDEVKRLSEENKRLHNEIECLRGKVLELEDRLSRSVEITEERVKRTAIIINLHYRTNFSKNIYYDY